MVNYILTKGDVQLTRLLFSFHIPVQLVRLDNKHPQLRSGECHDSIETECQVYSNSNFETAQMVGFETTTKTQV